MNRRDFLKFLGTQATTSAAFAGGLFAATALEKPGFVIPNPPDAIQEAIDSLGSKGGIVYLPDGTYSINKTISIPPNVQIVGEGSMAIIGCRIAIEKRSDAPMTFLSEDRDEILFSGCHFNLDDSGCRILYHFPEEEEKSRMKALMERLKKWFERRFYV